jgi:FKBP-type peptidyl-prolyl cis-trans isomerase FkpA
MKPSIAILAALVSVSVIGCGKETAQPEPATATPPESEAPAVAETMPGESAVIEIAPGLTAVILEKGYGRAAEPGDYVDVHYTGWLYDENAEDKRGSKFDSSIDKGQQFQFRLGEGRVIRGWDEGLVGMLLGEKRELTIAPEMGYGDRGAGNVIPPGATLVFEIALLGLESPDDVAED